MVGDTGLSPTGDTSGRLMPAPLERRRHPLGNAVCVRTDRDGSLLAKPFRLRASA